jgi:hypothetical protein
MSRLMLFWLDGSAHGSAALIGWARSLRSSAKEPRGANDTMSCCFPANGSNCRPPSEIVAAEEWPPQTIRRVKNVHASCDDSRFQNEAQMTPKAIFATALLAAITTAAQAETYTYMCKVGHHLYPVAVDEDKGTLTWRGQTYTDLKVGENCRVEFIATRDGVTATLCTATKGGAGLTIGDRSELDCQMSNNPSPRA